MDNTGRMTELLARLKKQMHGAVVEAMRERGLGYALSYGVAAMTVRRIAVEYVPDHAFARFLYRQDVRELRIAAAYIAEPGKVSVEELDFWARGVKNTELAENLAFGLLGKTAIAEQIMLRWLASGDELLSYCALMAGSKAIVTAENATQWDFASLDVSITKAVETQRTFVGTAAARFAERVDGILFPLQERLPLLVGFVKTGEGHAAEHLRAEIGWMLG